MTQRERIDQLEREVSDLRDLVRALQALITARPFGPYQPFKPLPRPQRWPNYPPTWPPNQPIYHGSCTINTPPNGDLIVMNT